MLAKLSYSFQGNEVSSLGELLQSEISSELDNALDGGGASVQDGGEHSGDDDIFKQLSDSSALLEQFFDFVNCDIKVNGPIRFTALNSK